MVSQDGRLESEPRKTDHDKAKGEPLFDDWLHHATYCRIPKIVEVEMFVKRRTHKGLDLLDYENEKAA